MVKSIFIAVLLIVFQSANAFTGIPTVNENLIEWEQVDASAINIHQGNGTYITTLPGDSISWLATDSGSYYLVATNEGDWTTWLRSDTVTVDSGIVNPPVPPIGGMIISELIECFDRNFTTTVNGVEFEAPYLDQDTRFNAHLSCDMTCPAGEIVIPISCDAGYVRSFDPNDFGISKNTLAVGTTVIDNNTVRCGVHGSELGQFIDRNSRIWDLTLAGLQASHRCISMPDLTQLADS